MSQSSVRKSLFFNVSSNLFSQLVSIIFIPILSRLYAPEQFGEVAFFLGISSCIIAVSSLRLSITIPIAENNNTKGIAFALSSVFIFGTTALIVMITQYTPFFFIIGIDSVSYLIAPYVLIVSLNGVLVNILISNGNYNFIGGSKLVTAVFLNLFRLVFFSFGLSDGLVYSLLISEVAAFFMLLLGSGKSLALFVKSLEWSVSPYLRFLYDFKDYPKYQVISQLVLIGTQYAPVFVLSATFDASFVGLYAMANNLVNLPVNSIGLALSQIYLGEYIKVENRNKILPHSIWIVLIFIVCSLPFLFIMGVWGTELTRFFLGEQWVDSAPIISLLIFLGVSKLCMSIISQSLNIFRAQRLQLAINILFFMLSYMSLYFAIQLGFDFYDTILVYTVSGSGALFFGIFLVLFNIRENLSNECCVHR